MNMEDYDYFQRHDAIKGVEVKGTDRLILLDFGDKNYHRLFEKEFGDFDIAGLYLLINSKTKPKKIYVGESTNIKKRNKGEIKKSPVQNFEFDKIILIWDGRHTKTSLFGEEAFRKALEKYCIQLFRDKEKYECQNTVGKPKPINFQTETTLENFKKHLFSLLKMHELI